MATLGSCLPWGPEYFVPRPASTLLDAEYFISGPPALPAPCVAPLIYIDPTCCMAGPAGEPKSFVSRPPHPPTPGPLPCQPRPCLGNLDIFYSDHPGSLSSLPHLWQPHYINRSHQFHGMSRQDPEYFICKKNRTTVFLHFRACLVPASGGLGLQRHCCYHFPRSKILQNCRCGHGKPNDCPQDARWVV